MTAGERKIFENVFVNRSSICGSRASWKVNKLDSNLDQTKYIWSVQYIESSRRSVLQRCLTSQIGHCSLVFLTWNDNTFDSVEEIRELLPWGLKLLVTRSTVRAGTTPTVMESINPPQSKDILGIKRVGCPVSYGFLECHRLFKCRRPWFGDYWRPVLKISI